ncbi:hypothetical protein P691DRAFT_821549 [Macrolepiota fuliginosa MF-IS2]|uniref:Uncharacterized protein n=1 Tax=Macrolepiota fuliginosa MF-IS2 TaxID=1400762 RepID=A0A9P5XKH9_9AGAR|nr:hypothetical protein P691DRAFT_821549 [Macrolepiota fuliginosa MF-IS2]
MGPSHIGPNTIRNVLPLLFYLSPPSFAAPIRDSSTTSSWLACLMALLIFSVVCLSTFKLLFVRYRRTSNLKGPTSSPDDRKYIHPNLKLSGFSAHTTCRGTGGCKAGFLIGLFGSPSFEIRSKPPEITLVYPGAEPSKSSSKHDVSGDTSTTCKTKNSGLSAGPVLLFDKSSSSWARCKLSTPSANGTRSRFLLSTQLSFDLGRIRRKQQRLPTQDNAPENLPWPHNHLEHATLRLVKLYTESQASLPLCSDNGIVSGCPPATGPHSLAVAHLNQPKPMAVSSLLSPLPVPLPFTQSVWSEERRCSNSTTDIMIDHPYNSALLNSMKTHPTSRRASLSPNLSVIDESSYRLTNLSPLSRSPLIDELTAPSFGYQAVTSPPPVAYSVYGTLKRREKMRSIRNRRSPPLGPSPLRSMILPEVDEGTPAQKSEPMVEDMENLSLPKRQSLQCQRLGLGLPALGLSPTASKERPLSQDANGNSSEGPESVLGFLRELAEETKDWDESIVLDEGFRSMIRCSQAILGSDSLENVHVKYSAPKVSSPDERNKTPPRFVSFWLENSPSP